MKKLKRIKAYNFFEKLLSGSITSALFQCILTILVFVVISRLIFHTNFELKECIEFNMVASLSVTLFIEEAIKLIKKKIDTKLEDSRKLNIDYDQLVKLYKNDKNAMCKSILFSDAKGLKKCNRKSSCTPIPESEIDKTQLPNISNHNIFLQQYFYPVLIEYINSNNYKIEIEDDKTKDYKLPSLISSLFHDLFHAHSTSVIYNNKNIRLDGYVIDNDRKRIVLQTSRTEYYKSLVTNRAMDLDLGDNLSIRNIFEFGPTIHPLSCSELSNHIGFNGFVKTSDDYIVMVQRGNRVSTYKKTLGCSVSASLKYQYAINSEGNLTEDLLEVAIKNEIHDELKIRQETYTFDLSQNIVSIYRDLVEGGKPQLLFYVECNLSKDIIQKNFSSESKKEKRNSVNIDGNKLIFIPFSDIRNSILFPTKYNQNRTINEPGSVLLTSDILLYNKQSYNIVPSSSASILMLIQYLNNTCSNAIGTSNKKCITDITSKRTQ